MAVRSAKAVFVGNIKGGVGKSTLTVYLTEYLRQRFKRHGVLLIDTDPQGTAFELLEPKSRVGEARFLPVGDHYDGVNMTTLDSVSSNVKGFVRISKKNANETFLLFQIYPGLSPHIISRIPYLIAICGTEENKAISGPLK